MCIRDSSLSNVSGNKSEPNYGEDDYWIIKIDSFGNIQWQKTFQGSSLDRAYSIVQTPDGGYIIGGQSSSNISPDKEENDIGNGDYWVIKLFPEDCTPIVYFRDVDLDGYGNLEDSILACELPIGYVLNGTDCDDSNDLIHPGIEDLCNGTDDNCNGLFDEDAIYFIWYLDSDEDNFGDNSIDSLSCFDLPGYVNNNFDCNDTIASINPDASEICNELDDNCNFIIDEGLTINTFYIDADGDSFGDADLFINSCLELIAGYVLDSTDCDDLNILVNPAAIETCNSFDDNCNLTIDEDLTFITYYIDADGDNYGNAEIDSVWCLPGYSNQTDPTSAI